MFAKNELTRKPKEFKFDLMHKYFWFNNDRYQITGYVRYFYTEGYLYLWAACNNNNYIWLCESLGNWFTLVKESEKTDIGIHIPALRPDNNFTYNEQQYTVNALSTFNGYYMEGELPELPYLQSKGVSIECSSQNNLIHFNIFQPDLVNMYVGKSVHLKDLKINNA